MKLLIDIGNTSLCWALANGADGADLGPMAGVRHGGGLPLDLLAAWEALERPARVVAGNVAGAELAAVVARVVRALWGLELEFATTRQDCLGLRVAYREPERLGVDRWLALLGAQGRIARATGAALILDAGTAATFDLLAPGGRHLGGLILPGLTMMRAGLLAGTRIPPGDPVPAAEPWATDTAAAIEAGGRQALAALAERLHGRLLDHLGCEGAAGSSPIILITGGDGPLILPLIGSGAGCERPVELVPDLVLRGLARWVSAAPDGALSAQ